MLNIDTDFIIAILKIYLADLFTQIPKIYVQDVNCNIVYNSKKIGKNLIVHHWGLD